MRVKGRKEKTTGDGQAASADDNAAQRPNMVLEGDEAVELYTRQISFNLTEMERQVELLREACMRTKKLLRDVE